VNIPKEKGLHREKENIPRFVKAYFLRALKNFLWKRRRLIAAAGIVCEKDPIRPHGRTNIQTSKKTPPRAAAHARFALLYAVNLQAGRRTLMPK
jgi:hypothetical protein